MYVKAQFSDIRQRKKWASADLAILSLPRWSSTEVERNILREKKKTHSELQLVVFFLQEAVRMVVSHECQLVFNTLKTGEFDFKTSQILQSGPHGMAYMQFCISDLIFHMDFSHFQLLGNLTTRKVAICANSDINRLFIDVQLFKCSSKQQEDEACVNICSDSLSLLSHQNSHCLSQTTVIVSFI